MARLRRSQPSVLLLMLPMEAVYQPSIHARSVMSVQRIVGGSEANRNEYPWLVFLHMKTTLDSFNCGGALITRDFVLTAAHCVSGELEGVFVYLGAHEFPDTNDTSTAVVASLVSVHDAYDDYKKLNDIALVKLSSPANFTLKVSPACLGLDGDVQVGDKVVVAGWGKLTNEGDEFPKTLMKVDLEVVDPMICKESYNGTIEINDNMMCSFASGKDSCVGDSGGPLLVEVGLGQWVAVGVVSFGAGCAQEYPGIYTRVSKYHNWINEIVQDPQC